MNDLKENKYMNIGDYNVYNPATDEKLYVNYDAASHRKKKCMNKERLQQELGLAVDKKRYMIGLISRLTDQKGLDLINYVIERIIDDYTQLVVIGTGEEVFGDTLYADRLNFMSVPDLEEEVEVVAKIRYSHKGALCRIKKVGKDQIVCKFYEPQRAITPGQAVVFYQGDYVMGGGTILR